MVHNVYATYKISPPKENKQHNKAKACNIIFVKKKKSADESNLNIPALLNVMKNAPLFNTRHYSLGF